MATTTTPVPLTGSELLSTIESLGESATRTELCRATGYFTTDKEGKTKTLYNSMLAELLKAKGMALPEAKGSGGPTPSFTTSTLTNGQVVIGKCYARMIGSQKGDSWDIKVDREGRSITLTMVD